MNITIPDFKDFEKQDYNGYKFLSYRINENNINNSFLLIEREGDKYYGHLIETNGKARICTELSNNVFETYLSLMKDYIDLINLRNCEWRISGNKTNWL